jgi:DNA-binding PadR family transcriptional regulator
MADFRSGDFDGTFEFFILSGFTDGPRSLSEIQARFRWAERLLFVAARKKGQRSGGVRELLETLQEEGLLRVEPRCAEQRTEEAYALTDLGELRVTQQRTRHGSFVAQRVEEVDLDRSFRKFLDRNSSGV